MEREQSGELQGAVSELVAFRNGFEHSRSSQTVNYIQGIASNLNERILQQSAEAERKAFDLQFVTCVSIVENVLESQASKVVIATLPGLETSFAQTLLKKWCARSENLLLFVCSPPPDTLGYRILNSPEESTFECIVREKRGIDRRTDSESR